MTRETLLRVAPVLALAALASCGASPSANKVRGGDGIVENEALTRLQLTSDDFREGQSIPARFTCDGAGEVPTLRWGEPPAATRSFALVIDDPDAPGGTFRHWGVFDIPASTRSIGGAQRIGTEVVNDFGKKGYGGPCPPQGHGAHHYHVKLFALDTGTLGLDAGAKIADVENSALRHAIGKGELTGTYERK